MKQTLRAIGVFALFTVMGCSGRSATNTTNRSTDAEANPEQFAAAKAETEAFERQNREAERNALGGAMIE